ncbi:TetR/AcrR family transcriptional regulator [Arthrobacter jinronghuae]|uniref:TetR family transcriptional regulator n=1 Tax=Arthrobacter jinronghuae TaxID=2964609 RepID=A0ABT1NWC7_9MICC|nr:TetR/AcrR family transcriptional regulator [Arthrobacter jinronghuae]MCQ1951014.1 TetR family transcriptional regulator [Arthrobacter jinronghuae]MCQ1954327.1 TetR family transcriptional regulator [Arthrobacter sp. zg-Y238]UWX79469.1 TetR family transcriptional regulator [Arthrobacter jinronghuae]
MTKGATEDCGLRERKRTATRAAITAHARILTAANGVNGFTVEQLCERVGISRRTFFNYFPAKEDAILGSPADDLPQDLVQRFVDGGAGSAGEGISPALVADFVDLAVGMTERMAMSRSEMAQLKEAVSAEPRLIQKAMRGSQETEETFARIVAARESLPADDPRVRATVAVFGALVQRAGLRFFDPANTDSYRSILVTEVNAAIAVFSSASPLSVEPTDHRPASTAPADTAKDSK